MEIGRVYKRKKGCFSKKVKIRLKNGITKNIKICFFKHRFVCIETNIGIMITRSKKFENNIKFNPEHILQGCTFKYDNSYFVAQYLVKDVNESHFIDCGGLTPDGLSFIKAKADCNTITWEEYEKRRISINCKFPPHK